MREGFAKGARLKEIRETRGEFKAIDLTLETLGPKDLAIVQADQVDAAVKYVDEVVSYGKPVSHPTTPAAGTPAGATSPQPANPPSSPVLV